MKNVKLASILIIAIIYILVFTACDYTNTRTVLPPTIKTIYSNTLNELVIDNTITQTQAYKVLKEVKKTVSEDKGCCYGFNVLVQSGVLTLEQANTISEKLQLAMKNTKTK